MDQHKAELGGTQQPENRRSDRRLARGLEDVSYLFLSQSANEAGATGEGPRDPPGQTRSEPAGPPMATILRAASAVNRDLLVSLLDGNTAVLEEGMQSIDINIPCDPLSAIDLIAVDSLNQPVIIDVDISTDDGLLLRGISHFDWVVRNIPIVRRMYRGRTINFSAQPKLFLVAPGFSPLLKCVAERIAHPKVTCFGYRAVTVPNGTGILFERS